MELYFCVSESLNPSESELSQPGGGKYVTHSQRPYFYEPGNFTKEIGYETEKRCNLELKKMQRLYDRIHVTSHCESFKLYIERREVN